MLCAGFYGLNGLNAITSAKIWKIYIVPRLIHNLKVILNTVKVIEKIDNYQRQRLNQHQHRPSCCSNPATYLISGVLPLQAKVDKKVLSTFD